jgi:hypothetical protein
LLAGRQGREQSNWACPALLFGLRISVEQVFVEFLVVVCGSVGEVVLLHVPDEQLSPVFAMRINLFYLLLDITDVPPSCRSDLRNAA